MRIGKASICIASIVLAVGAAAYAQKPKYEGQGSAIVTVLPKQDGAVPASVANQDLAVKVNGKNAKVTKWASLANAQSNLEVVLLIDSSARSSLSTQFDDMRKFLRGLPPNSKAGVAYMVNGQAKFSGPLTTDHESLVKALQIPIGSIGANGSPYFCVSDLAKNWPSRDADALREVVMITDGFDPYNPRFDPDGPYIQQAVRDAVRARIVVYSIFWKNKGIADEYPSVNNTGQNLLTILTSATGGKNFWNGMGNPVSFGYYFDELKRRFQNQYELGFTGAAGNKPDVESFKLKLKAPGAEITAPQQVLMVPTGQLAE